MNFPAGVISLNSLSKSQKPPSDGDDDSMESNPTYNNPTNFLHYTLQQKSEAPVDNGLQSIIEMGDEPQVTVGSVDSTSSSVFYSKPTFDGLGAETSEDSNSVYYSQPFWSSHLPLEDTIGLHDHPPPLPKSRDGDGIATVLNISYRRILSSESTPLRS